MWKITTFGQGIQWNWKSIEFVDYFQIENKKAIQRFKIFLKFKNEKKKSFLNFKKITRNYFNYQYYKFD